MPDLNWNILNWGIIKEMLTMKQIATIKEMQNAGTRVCNIAEVLQVDRKTVRKYMNEENFEEPLLIQKTRSSKVDKWKHIIDGWLDEDRRMRYKQRHTARRVHERLSKEYANEYDCSYPSIQRYCKLRKQINEATNKKGNLELVWKSSEAQVDFGEADFSMDGKFETMKYLVVSFPFSNAAYVQVFGGETAECVCQGLIDIFHRIGGVPSRIVFDNASGVGKRIGDKISMTDLFLRFKCHYRFDVTFCNPYSGHEKGHVENKVGYIRRNFFVPKPEFEVIEKFNEALLSKCEEDMNRAHYKKLQNIFDLFEHEKKTLSPLPIKPFRAIRLEVVRTDGYGKFCLNGKHWYSSSPDFALRELVVAIGAHRVEALEKSGNLIVTHKRMYGAKRTDTTDWSTSVARLIHNPGSWKNSGLRNELPNDLASSMDSMDKSGLREALRIMQRAERNFDFDTVIFAMVEATKCGSLNSFNVEAIASRILNCGLNCQPDSGPDLSSYDETFLARGGLQ